MSSHHIVREKQEPALLVLGLDGFDDELLGQLLEWSPTLIVTEPIAERLNAYGIKVDWVLTDAVAEDIQSDIKQLQLNGNTELKTALNFLLAENYSAVNIITDGFILEGYEQYAGLINLMIFSGNKKIYPITSGFSKWKPAGDIIEILNKLGDINVTGLTSVGPNRYKTAADGLFTIQFNGPHLFITEEV